MSKAVVIIPTYNEIENAVRTAICTHSYGMSSVTGDVCANPLVLCILFKQLDLGGTSSNPGA